MEFLITFFSIDLDSTAAAEFVDLTMAEHYMQLFSKCLINFAERAVKRMKEDNGSIIFISAPGCNSTQTVLQGYDMEGIIENHCF